MAVQYWGGSGVASLCRGRGAYGQRHRFHPPVAWLPLRARARAGGRRHVSESERNAFMPARPSGSIRGWVGFFARAIASGTLFGGTIRVRPAIDQTATLRAETFFLPSTIVPGGHTLLFGLFFPPLSLYDPLPHYFFMS